jgi:alpha-mannosidase
MSAQPHAHAGVMPIRTLAFGGDQAVLAGGRKLPEHWFELGDERLVVTAIKRSESGDGLIVRLFNPTERAIETSLAIGLPHGGIALASMAEELVRELGTSPLTLPVGSGEIVTLLIRKP